MIEEELREAFARHEVQAPALDPLRRAIDTLAARRRRRRMKTRTGAAAVLAVLALASPVQLWRSGAPGEVIDPAIATLAPVVAPEGALNLLLLGLDQHAGRPDARADTIMLIHVPAVGGNAYLISFERDLLVDVPGEGRSKINGTYHLGGAIGTKQAVERLTGVRIDAVAEVKFGAVRSIADALGGVPVCLPERVKSHHTGVIYPAGCRTYRGAEATDLLRQRFGMSNGAYDRDRVGQRVVRGLAQKAGELDLLRDAETLTRLVRTPGLRLHTGDLSLLGLALRLDRIEWSDIIGISQPTFRQRTVNDLTAGEHLDPVVAPKLFAALRADTLDAFVLTHPDWVLPQE
ncbi:LCP family protein [Catellatospora sichuanensis]|uniref:LCP family protein n=1 Tax=Catellatospora sichuanensis TaxID=1969805 RepID=UPI001182B8CC|nr:LCP family protein [Catellatospora sichuanensis]